MEPLCKGNYKILLSHEKLTKPTIYTDDSPPTIKMLMTKQRQRITKVHSSTGCKRRRTKLCETSLLTEAATETNEDNSCSTEHLLKLTCDQQPTTANLEASERGSAVVWDENNIFVGKRVAGYFDATQPGQWTKPHGKSKSRNGREYGQLFIGTVVSYAPESSPGERDKLFFPYTT
jgi:hypothetical protein